MKPKYGYGFFSVDSSGEFRQKILFFYWDPDEELYHSVSSLSNKKLEIEAMRKNMQTFLDSEKILINKKNVRAGVAHVEVGFLFSAKRPYVEFLILFKGDVSKGINLYENYYEKERVEYDYRVMWVFPENFRVVRADFGCSYNLVDSRIIYFDVEKGSEVSGYEFIEFLVL
ncbi:MAG: hypothetical protein RMI56_00590 [Sulfolobales archaeon]|nr:hypothetical protein [Sulfolobales archaeon]MDW8082277.1 hypothetical protein [Sulfolobales archaeon]